MLNETSADQDNELPQLVAKMKMVMLIGRLQEEVWNLFPTMSRITDQKWLKLCHWEIQA